MDAPLLRGRRYLSDEPRDAILHVQWQVCECTSRHGHAHRNTLSVLAAPLHHSLGPVSSVTASSTDRPRGPVHPLYRAPCVTHARTPTARGGGSLPGLETSRVAVDTGQTGAVWNFRAR